MGWNGLERNKLDFILTDLLPVELSELLSYSSFYSFLLEPEQQRKISKITQVLKENKAKSNSVMFKDGWSTKPLKYNIMKGYKTSREMSVIQPVSALNLYLFIECYQKEILDFFEKNHCFSLRYHKKNTNLYYKTKSKTITEYFQPQSRRLGKASIQQAGNYFRVSPFESINAFTDSLVWRMCNFRFKLYAKMDYKACFDSIYTHSFSWIIERNVIDAKNANNSNLYITIDRILQNINGRSSNGIVVGPEFSRMIAEILLQHIDNEIKLSLSNDGLQWHKDYEVFRYVDDFFIFADEQNNIDLIIEKYAATAEKYRLRLNELQFIKDETPCVPKEWLEKTRILSDTIGGFFFKGRKEEFNSLDEEKRFLVTTDYIPVDRIKDQISALMKQFPDERRTIVSFLLSTLLNNISKKRNGYKLFGKNGDGKSLLLIDLALYIYAFFPSFDQTRKIISFIAYINDELNFKDNQAKKQKLYHILQRYSFVFHFGNMSDLCDWFPFYYEYGIHLEMQTENKLFTEAVKNDNPIIWANILLYSQYNNSLYAKVLCSLEPIIQQKIDDIFGKEEMLHSEFWYVLVFHNCPFISSQLRLSMSSLIDSIRAKAAAEASIAQAKGHYYPSADVTMLVCDYLQRQSPAGNKPDESLFNWKGIKDFSEQITYRTYQRTVFKKYKKNRYGLYASVT